ncbi:MAG: metallophosphoesterase [Bacteroidaceae bacterium]|nr:metallophosphoesterase [Bacteroidaceae bacterium]
MKQKNVFLFVLLSLFGISPCLADHYVTSVAAPDASWLTVSLSANGSKEVVLPAAAGTYSVPLNTNLNVSVTARPTWAKITQAAKGVIAVEAKANTDAAARKGILTLKAKDGKLLYLYLCQYGTGSSAYVNKDGLNLYADDPVDSFFVQSNASYVLEKPSWLRVTTDASGKYVCTADRIYDAAQRTGDILIKDSTGAVLKTVAVTQHYHGTAWFRKPCFAVISDIHFGDTDAQGWNNRMPRVLKTLSSHIPKVQYVFVVGDLANNGLESQYNSIVSYFGDPGMMDQSIKVVFIRGNHDHYNGETGLAAYDRIIGQPANRYMDIHGYPFITLGSNSGDYRGWYCYNDATMNFLKQSLKDADEKYPGKPIFVFNHVLPYHTVIGSYESDYAAYALGLDEALQPYPQVIDFSAHTHMGITDPHQIYQKHYTAVNDGSQKRDSNPSHFPGWYQLNADKEIDYGAVTEGFVVHVDDDDRVIIERWNTSRNLKYDEDWVLPPPFDGTNFTYKDRDGGKKPWWPDGAALTVTNQTATSCRITFPHAMDDNAVNRYLITVTNAAGTTVRSINQCALLNMGSQRPSQMVIPIADLPSATPLTVKVYAQDFYDQNSPTLSTTFTLPK